jgi:hypothetical protein
VHGSSLSGHRNGFCLPCWWGRFILLALLLQRRKGGMPMSDDRWADARRLEAWAGETRVNLIRAVALVAFYGHHLLNVYVFKDQSAGGVFHVEVTAIVIAWAAATGVLYTCLARRWVPPALKFVATAWDLVLVTALVIVSPDGPRSPLIFLYFVVVAAAPLRLSLPLVQFATLGAWAAAAVAVGYYVFFRVGTEAYYAEGSTSRLARPAEVIFLMSLGAVGLLGGQVVRQARRLVQGYPVRVEGPREAA